MSRSNSSDFLVLDMDTTSDDASAGSSPPATVPVAPVAFNNDSTDTDTDDMDTSMDARSPTSMYASTTAKEAALLGVALTALWDDAMDRGLFRYDVRDVDTRVLDGSTWRFVAQLNEGRATKKRPTEFRVDTVVQPFDGTKFNFTKAYAREVLFQFEPSVGAAKGSAPQLLDKAECGLSPNLVLINVSPIDYGHVLLVPRVNDCLQQLADTSTMELALHFAKEADSGAFRVGFNSLGAYATINHLHFQAYFLEQPFPVELAGTMPLLYCASPTGVSLRRLSDYPVRGFVAELEPGVPPSRGLPALARLIGRACEQLSAGNVPHNVFITERGRRVFLFPQRFAERLSLGEVPEEVVATGVNPAVFEIAGHMLFKRAEDYEGADEASCERMLSYASVSEECFLELAQALFGARVFPKSKLV